MWKNSYGSHAACIDRKYKEDRWGNVREDALSEAMKKKYALSDDINKGAAALRNVYII